jgi:hypothetical protein
MIRSVAGWNSRGSGISRSGSTGDASIEKNAFSLADDLRLFWTVDDKDVGINVLSFREGDEPGGQAAADQDDIKVSGGSFHRRGLRRVRVAGRG